jgi:hypothetical protein
MTKKKNIRQLTLCKQTLTYLAAEAQAKTEGGGLEVICSV